MKIGDRVQVVIPYWGREPKTFVGVITGVGRDGHSWLIRKDNTKYPRGIHKTFCKPEGVPDGQEQDAV